MFRNAWDFSGLLAWCSHRSPRKFCAMTTVFCENCVFYGQGFVRSEATPIRFARTTSLHAGFCSGFVLAEGQAAPFVVAEQHQLVLDVGVTSAFSNRTCNNCPVGAAQKKRRTWRAPIFEFHLRFRMAQAFLAAMVITEHTFCLLHLSLASRASRFSVRTNCPPILRRHRLGVETADRVCPKNHHVHVTVR